MRVCPRPAPEQAANAEPIDAARLFREHARYVAAFLRKYGVADGFVDDAVQEVFLLAHTLGGYRPGPATARTWLSAIAVRVAANARRARARASARVSTDPHATDSLVGLSSPEALYEQQQHVALAERALSEMSDSHRDVFVRFNLLGQSCDEIASALGIPTGTVYSRLHAARKSPSLESAREAIAA